MIKFFHWYFLFLLLCFYRLLFNTWVNMLPREPQGHNRQRQRRLGLSSAFSPGLTKESMTVLTLLHDLFGDWRQTVISSLTCAEVQMGASSSIATIVRMGQQDVMPRAFPSTILQLSSVEPKWSGFIKPVHSPFQQAKSILNNPRKIPTSAKESRCCLAEYVQLRKQN